MWGESLRLTLKKKFQAALNESVFPDDWKNGNVSVHKSAPSICQDIWKGNASVFEYFIENELFSVCQSGFLPDHSCTSQILSIIHEIQKSFESPLIDVRGVFLDISNMFDKVWHKGPVYKQVSKV